MNKEKQIEEMANDLWVLSSLQYNPNHTISYHYATGLYSLGYRKASDVARRFLRRLRVSVALHTVI